MSGKSRKCLENPELLEQLALIKMRLSGLICALNERSPLKYSCCPLKGSCPRVLVRVLILIAVAMMMVTMLMMAITTIT